VNIRQQ